MEKIGNLKVIYASFNTRVILIKVNNEFFKNNDKFIIVKIKDDKFIITKPTIDYSTKAFKIRKSSNAYSFTISIAIETGTYAFDEEESNEDMLVAYLK